MITNADPGRIIYLSVGLKDGSMEAFDDVKDAVAHATDLVKGEDSERVIFVAVARARVRMAVRVEPIAPPPVPLTPSEPPAPAHAWEGSQGLMHEQAAD